jgi:uracil-DNA glycosylase
MKNLLKNIRACTACKAYLPMGCRPVVQLSAASKVVIIGQAPGRRVHESGIPWNDRSGATLRSWLQVDEDQFYDAAFFSIMPMGFCYPGKAISGDMPPRKECASLWHSQILENYTSRPLVLLIGQYAQRHYLKTSGAENLTATVKNYAAYLPHYFPLPHPSPRNQNWVKTNPWFMQETIPVFQQKIKEALHPNITAGKKQLA